jgi:hypothetical protein
MENISEITNELAPPEPPKSHVPNPNDAPDPSN